MEINTQIPVSPQGTQSFGQLPSANSIFKEAWAIYKQGFWYFLKISLVPVLAMLVLDLVTGMQAVGGIKPVEALLIAVVAVAVIYISLWGWATMLLAVKDYPNVVSVSDAYKNSKHLIWPLFVVGLLAGLAVMGGLILLIVPGIIFALWFSQSYFAVLDEKGKGTSALTYSKNLVKGRLGEVFLKNLYIIVITIAISLVIGILTGGMNSNSQTSTIFNNLFSWIWTPLVTLYSYKLYKHLQATSKQA